MSYLEALKDRIAKAVEDREMFSITLNNIEHITFPLEDKKRLEYVFKAKLRRTEKLLADLRANLARFEEPK